MICFDLIVDLCVLRFCRLFLKSRMKPLLVVFVCWIDIEFLVSSG